MLSSGLGGNASGICQFSARTEVSLWLAGKHDIIPVAEHDVRRDAKVARRDVRSGAKLARKTNPFR